MISSIAPPVFSSALNTQLFFNIQQQANFATDCDVCHCYCGNVPCSIRWRLLVEAWTRSVLRQGCIIEEMVFQGTPSTWRSILIEAYGIDFCIHVVLRCGSAPDKQQVSDHEIPADSMGAKAGRLHSSCSWTCSVGACIFHDCLKCARQVIQQFA